MSELVSEFVEWCGEQCYRGVEKTNVVINLKFLLDGPPEFPGKEKGEFRSDVWQRCLMPLRYLSDKFIHCKHVSFNLKFQW